jgi:hypothetical protein
MGHLLEIAQQTFARNKHTDTPGIMGGTSLIHKTSKTTKITIIKGGWLVLNKTSDSKID